MKNRKRIAAFTVAETLVAMLLAGIVFLSLTEGLFLAGRYAGERRRKMDAGMDFYGGCLRLAEAVAAADSVRAGKGAAALLFRGGSCTPLALSAGDSVLVLGEGRSADTLLCGVAVLAALPGGASRPDTVAVRIERPDGGGELKFVTLLRPGRVAEDALETIIEKYGYD